MVMVIILVIFMVIIMAIILLIIMVILMPVPREHRSPSGLTYAGHCCQSKLNTMVGPPGIFFTG